MAITGVVVVCILLAVLIARIGTRSFDTEWPPISDEEFLRRSPNGTDPAMALKVRRIIAEQSGVPYDKVYPEQSLSEDLGMD